MDLRLWDFQVQAVEELRDNIRSGVMNQILCAPTGSGKTICATYLIRECYDKGKRALFVADRVALIDQTSAVLDKYGIPHGVIQGKHWRWAPYRRVQVASAQTLMRRGWPDTDLIIIDECHGLYKTVMKRITRRDTITIGLSATPFSRGLGRYYDAVVSVTTTNALIEQGRLANYRIFAASEPDMEGAKVEAGEWTDEEAAKRSLPIVGDCVAEYLRHAAGRKFIAFGVTVAHCEEIQRQFMAAGVQCGLYTTHTNDTERRALLEEFSRPDATVRGLVSVAALSKGFDRPDVECVIIARPLRSGFGEHLQMLGRGLRAHPGKDECLILDHAGNTLRFWDRMQDFYERGAVELDDGKRRKTTKTTKPITEPRKCPTCAHIHRPLPHCPACGFEYPRRKSKVEHVEGTLNELTGLPSGSADDRQAVYSQLLYIARDRGYAVGWAAHQYRARYDAWPNGLTKEPAPPTDATLRWVRSRMIAWAKAKGRAA